MDGEWYAEIKIADEETIISRPCHRYFSRNKITAREEEEEEEEESIVHLLFFMQDQRKTRIETQQPISMTIVVRLEGTNILCISLDKKKMEFKYNAHTKLYTHEESTGRPYTCVRLSKKETPGPIQQLDVIANYQDILQICSSAHADRTREDIKQ